MIGQGQGSIHEPLFKLEDIERIFQPLVESSSSSSSATETDKNKDKDKEKDKESKNAIDKNSITTAADAATSLTTGYHCNNDNEHTLLTHPNNTPP